MHQALREGKILLCVDGLEDKQCPRVEEILRKAGGLAYDKFSVKAEPKPKKKPVNRRPAVKRKEIQDPV